MKENGKQNEGRNGNGNLKKKLNIDVPQQGPHNRLGSKMNGNGKQNEGRNGNGKQNDASAETFLLRSQQRATGKLVYSKNCTRFLSF